ncbi:RdgB/HAM1 family non-canonical purine NTP pyrophosphatase [Oenococcus oeni]|uniref:RdgB/HAM1 family non-canonical purine NTP pyrophosphatase n=1 Tax=Oenococcus oeni TaxID=1247 RepID=UPI001646FA43|nr:RdgB/HAM1 family non-canonical purine NTP pyrophosphatase [Oenococcus oeni]
MFFDYFSYYVNMQRIIFATKNRGKSQEAASILNGRFDLIDLNHLSNIPEIVENGSSFLENAEIKAKTTAQLYPNDLVMAEDTGLCIDALDGRPGIYSARYAGDHNDQANVEKVLKELKGLPTEKRSAHFTTIIVLLGLKKEIIAKGISEGTILDHQEGLDGFGYDPIFYSHDLGKSFGQASEKEKDSISHRAKALKDLISQIKA